jgi:hypothetical protein
MEHRGRPSDHIRWAGRRLALVIVTATRKPGRAYPDKWDKILNDNL